MGALLKISIRNTLRHSRRTLSSALTIAVGLAMFIFMNSLYKGMDHAAINNMINLTTSSVKIHTQSYTKEKKSLPLDHGIDSYDSLSTFLSSNHRVKSFTRRTEFLGQLSNYTDVLPVIGTVIDPSSDTMVFNLHNYLEGEFFPGKSDREVIIGKSLARELNVSIGDFVTLHALTRYESRNADEFIITGLINSSDPNLNKNSLFITFQDANSFLDLDGLITEIDLQVFRSQNLGKMIQEMEQIGISIENRFYNLKTTTFKELGAAFFEMAKQKQSFGMLFMLLILLIASVGIFNTVLMSVYERIREIGILRSHGMRSFDIMVMFCTEGLITGLLGSILGLFIGSVANSYLIYKGFPLEIFAGNVNTTGIPVWGTIYGEWNPDVMFFAFIFGILTATLAGLIPAYKASKMNIIETLRFV
jgi:putative ABC transport system permease protein